MHKALARQLRKSVGIEDAGQLAAFVAAASKLATQAGVGTDLARGLTGLG